MNENDETDTISVFGTFAGVHWKGYEVMHKKKHAHKLRNNIKIKDLDMNLDSDSNVTIMCNKNHVNICGMRVIPWT